MRVSRVPATHIGRYRHHYLLAAVLLLAWFLLPRLIRMPAPPASPPIVLGTPRALPPAAGPEHHPRRVGESEWIVRSVLDREGGDWGLYRMSLADGRSQLVADDPDESEYGPAISPDGDRIAYARLGPAGCDVVVRSFAGDAAASVAQCAAALPTPVDWSPSGSLLAYTASRASDDAGQRRIHLLDIETASRRPLTAAGPSNRFEHYPRFSPDGRKLAFLRGELLPNLQSTLWLFDVASGAETQLTMQPAELAGMTWIDERTLLFSVLDGARLIDVVTGRQTVVESAAFMHPDYRREDGTLVAVAPRVRRGLARIGADRDAVLVAGSAGDDHSGRLSPDERRLTFVSRRAGRDELWIANADGRGERRLTRFEGPAVRHPDWSHDGSRILVTVEEDARERLYIVDAFSGNATPVATGFDEITAPRWMAGGWVAGCRDTSGWGICAGDEDGARRIADGYFRPHPGRAGNLYVVDDRGALFNMSVTDGSVTKILAGMPAAGRNGWEVDEGTLYFLAAGETARSGRLMRVDLGGGEPETLYTGAMPVRDATISIGRESGDILLALYRDPSDDLVVYEDVFLGQR